VNFTLDGSGFLNGNCDSGVGAAALDGTLTLMEDTTGSGFLKATHPEGDSLTYEIVENGTKGTALITNLSSGAYDYIPHSDANGTDTFTFAAKDENGNQSDPATMTVTITPVNDSPVARDRTLSVAENQTAAGTLSATDIDGDALTYSSVNPPARGSVQITNTATGAYTYTSSGGIGTDSFTYKATDSSGAESNIAKVTVNVAASAKPAVTVSASPRSPDTAGAAVTFTAAANGGSGYEYRFYLRGPSTRYRWRIVQHYSTDSTWAWNTSSVDIGTSRVLVLARHAETKAHFAREQTRYTILTP
jgi:hypothetical protein